MPDRAARFVVARAILDTIFRDVNERRRILPPERELARQLSVSRGILRESLRILEIQGLIEVRPGRNGGIRVRRPHTNAAADNIALLAQWQHYGIEQLIDARCMIEVVSARFLCSGERELFLRQLQRQMTQTRHLTHRKVKHSLFHHLIVAGTGNRLLLQTYRAICQALYLNFGGCSATELACEVSADDHLSIINAALLGDADQVEQLIRRHSAALIDRRQIGSRHINFCVPSSSAMSNQMSTVV